MSWKQRRHPPSRVMARLNLLCGKCGEAWTDHIDQAAKPTALRNRLTSIACNVCGGDWNVIVASPDPHGDGDAKILRTLA